MFTEQEWKTTLYAIHLTWRLRGSELIYFRVGFGVWVCTPLSLPLFLPLCPLLLLLPPLLLPSTPFSPASALDPDP
jgi:hypothetical protein